MKKQIICAFSLLLILLIFCGKMPVKAENNAENNTYEDLLSEFDFSNVNDSIFADDNFSDINFEECVKTVINGDSYFKEKGFLPKVFSLLLKEVKDNLHIVLFLISFSVFGGLLSNLQSSFCSSGVSEIAFLSVYFVFSFVLVKGFAISFNLAKQTIESQTAFIKACAPIYAAAAASYGQITTASAVNIAFLFLIEICSSLITKYLLPSAKWIFLLSVVNNSSDKIQLTKLIRVLKQSINWILGMAMTVFVGFLSLSGLKGAAIDNIGLKTVKYAMGSFVPVVGRLLSDTVDTVLSSAALIKTSVSVAGIIIIIIMCIYPIIKLTVIMWLYRITAGIIEPVSDKRLGNLMTAASDAVEILFTLLITITVVMILAGGIIIMLCGIYK